MTSPQAKELTIGFVGAGTVGAALATGLAQAGHRVMVVASRSASSARRLADQVPGCSAVTPAEAAQRTDLLFLTVPDDAIGQVADSLPWHPGQRVVHCSGATPLDALASAKEAGTAIGAFHPLQTFAGGDDPEEVGTLTGSTFAIEAGDDALRRVLHDMASDLGGHGVDLPGEARALYHISGVLASNYLVALLAEAADLWARFGYNRSEGLTALLPLVQGTVRNVERQGIPGALTGPIARGDSGTVATHLAAMREQAPEAMSLYRELARRTVRVALEKGRLTDDEAARILALVEGALVQGGSTA